MRFTYVLLLGLSILVIGAACTDDKKIKSQEKKEQISTVDYTNFSLPDQPNILWLVAEDLSPYLPPFGDSTITTPNISRLAREGVTYTNFYSPSGVCAPSRAAIATGMYPTRIGAMHMRTGPWWDFDYQHPEPTFQGKTIYEAMPPEGVHMHSEYLRRAGYYCTNNDKQDYQFRAEMTAWDESSKTAHWRNRKKDQPFFAIFNFGVSHESRIWKKKNDSLWVDENLSISLPPYLQDTEISRNDMRRMYSNIKEMDYQVGQVLEQLEEDGELENTIIFWYGDHGGPLPRSKRTLYDSGIQSPLVVRFPKKQLQGLVDEQLLSFIDLKPTLLSIIGEEPPMYVDGKAWLGKYASGKQREYIHAAADSFDGCCYDRVRAVRDHRFKYVRNYLPQQPYYLPIPFRENMPVMQELLRLRDSNALNETQAQWFRMTKDPEELFDTFKDPFEIENLADNPDYTKKLQELREEMDSWVEDTNDRGMISEEDYIKTIWPDGEQPVTTTPIVTKESDGLVITTGTKGASIGFQWLAPDERPSRTWEIYQGPIREKEGMTLVARAHRIGYAPSMAAYYK